MNFYPYFPSMKRAVDNEYILNLDCMNLKAYPPAACLYEQLVRYPQEIVMHVMDFVTTTVFTEMFADHPDLDLESVSFKVGRVWISRVAAAADGDDDDDLIVFHPCQVRPYNLEASVNLRDLNPEDIDKVVSIKGFVVRVSNPIPEMKRGM